jgi:hypothetical protein
MARLKGPFLTAHWGHYRDGFHPNSIRLKIQQRLLRQISPVATVLVQLVDGKQIDCVARCIDRFDKKRPCIACVVAAAAPSSPGSDSPIGGLSMAMIQQFFESGIVPRSSCMYI